LLHIQIANLNQSQHGLKPLGDDLGREPNQDQVEPIQLKKTSIQQFFIEEMKTFKALLA
jgi:hypothetical protein